MNGSYRMHKTVSVDEWIEICKNNKNIPVNTVVNGSSMEPIIKKNKDIMTVLPIDGFPPVGSIVLFKSNDEYVIHRLCKVDGDTVVTWGDFCLLPDSPMSKNNILGVVVFVKKKFFTLYTGGKTQILYGKLYDKFFRKYYIKYRILRHKIFGKIRMNIKK